MISLDRFKNKDGKITMLAFDHRSSFKKSMEKSLGREVQIDEIIDLKAGILESFKEFNTGFLIDMDYGLPAYRRQNLKNPFLLPIEKSGYTEEEGERLVDLGYTARELKESGAEGIKILVYTNPNIKSWTKQLETIKLAMDDSRENGLPYFLEFVLYDKDQISAGTVYQNVKSAIDAGIIPDVWKIPYPGSAEECQKISEIVGDTPWILLTGGVSFEEFLDQYKISVQNGSKGFLAGRALWSDIFDFLQDEEGKKNFLENVLPERFKKLLEI